MVHNGVVENYDRLKARLLKAGHTFRSETDTEVLAHVIGEYYEKRRAEKEHRQRADARGLRCPA